MSDSQSSIFYPPVFGLFLIHKIVGLGNVSLYFSLLGMQMFHLVAGAFFIYVLGLRKLGLSKFASFTSALVYLGLGWNIDFVRAAGTISFMLGLIPLMILVLIHYLERPDRRRFLMMVGALALLLYAGGIVNFFFYVWLNFALILGFSWKFRFFRLGESDLSLPPLAFRILLLAPAWAVGIYALQLVAAYIVSADVAHSLLSYDYIAFFGSRLYDLVGLILPRFGLNGFGQLANPRLIPQLAGANSFYVGWLTLLLAALALGGWRRSRLSWLFGGLAGLNALLSFGALFWVYDLTYPFPGNWLFRGHYKYWVMVGVYLALLAGLGIQSLIDQSKTGPVIRRLLIGTGVMAMLLGLGFFFSGYSIFGLGVASLKQVAGAGEALTIAQSLASYLARSLLMLGLATAAIFALYHRPNSLVVRGLVAISLLVDISINYKYLAASTVPPQEALSNHFFNCCHGQSLLSMLPKPTQAYLVPELVGVDTAVTYSAIPNKGLVAITDRMIDRIGNPNTKLLQTAGITVVMSLAPLKDSAYQLITSRPVTEQNYRQLFIYNASGDVHDDWGPDPSLIGRTVYYYRVPDSQAVRFSTDYTTSPNQAEMIKFVTEGPYRVQVPVIQALRFQLPLARPGLTNQIETEIDQPTYKRYRIRGSQPGLLSVNIPYSRIWQASINHLPVDLYPANGAFMAVKLEPRDPETVVELSVNRGPLRFGLFVTVLSGLTLIRAWLSARRKPSKIS